MNTREYAYKNGTSEPTARKRLEIEVTAGRMKKVYGKYPARYGGATIMVKTVDYQPVEGTPNET